MAGRSSANEHTTADPSEEPRVVRFHALHRTAQDELARLLADGDESQEAQRLRAIAERIMWSSCANWLVSLERFKEASDASAASARQGELAIKLEKSTLPDRVHQLELVVKRAKTAGTRTRGAAQARRQ